MIPFSLFPTGRLGAALVVAAVGLATPSPRTSIPVGRPLVLMVPGRGYFVQDTAALRADWYGALDRGLSAVGQPALLEESDFRLVWYADVLDPAVPVECRERRPSGPGARGGGEDLASALSAALTVAAMIADWAGTLDGPPLRAVAGDLLYFGDDLKRCAAEERIADALAEAARGGRPVVLIAHSFGSLVAHSHLNTRDSASAPRVERWITIGSLIGRPELRTLLLGPDGRALARPARVGSWVNVRDPGDVLGAPLVGIRADSVASDGIADLVTESASAGDPHDPTRYLSDPATARAILGEW